MDTWSQGKLARYGSCVLGVIATAVAASIAATFGAVFLSDSAMSFVLLWLAVAVTLGFLLWRLTPVKRLMITVALVVLSAIFMPRHGCGPEEGAVTSCASQ